jgi:hypothetical protein
MSCRNMGYEFVERQSVMLTMPIRNRRIHFFLISLWNISHQTHQRCMWSSLFINVIAIWAPGACWHFFPFFDSKGLVWPVMVVAAWINSPVPQITIVILCSITVSNLSYKLKIFNSNLRRLTDYTGWGFPLFSSAATDECNDLTIKTPLSAGPSKFLAIHNSLSSHFIWRYILQESNRPLHSRHCSGSIPACAIQRTVLHRIHSPIWVLLAVPWGQVANCRH